MINGVGGYGHKLVICANVFIRKDDKYLLLRRSPHKKYAPNYVHPVGGKVDLDEDPMEAGKRELLEEVEEGSLEWFTEDEIHKENLFPSVEKLIGHILNREVGTVFATFRYNHDDDGKIQVESINLCTK